MIEHDGVAARHRGTRTSTCNACNPSPWRRRETKHILHSHDLICSKAPSPKLNKALHDAHRAYSLDPLFVCKVKTDDGLLLDGRKYCDLRSNVLPRLRNVRKLPLFLVSGSKPSKSIQTYRSLVMKELQKKSNAVPLHCTIPVCFFPGVEASLCQLTMTPSTLLISYLLQEQVSKIVLQTTKEVMMRRFPVVPVEHSLFFGVCWQGYAISFLVPTVPCRNETFTIYVSKHHHRFFSGVPSSLFGLSRLPSSFSGPRSVTRVLLFNSLLPGIGRRPDPHALHSVARSARGERRRGSAGERKGS